MPGDQEHEIDHEPEEAKLHNDVDASSHQNQRKRHEREGGDHVAFDKDLEVLQILCVSNPWMIREESTDLGSAP